MNKLEIVYFNAMIFSKSFSLLHLLMLRLL